MINEYNPRINPYLEFVYKRNYGIVDSYLFEQDTALTGNAPQAQVQNNALTGNAPQAQVQKKGILGSFASGFKKSYDASSVFSPEEIQMYEKMKSKIDPFVEKAVDFAKVTGKFWSALKIPFPLAVAVVTGVLMGGFGTVPMVVLVYAVQKKVVNAVEWLIGLKGHEKKHESLNFSDYYHRRVLEEGLYDTIASGAGMVGGSLGNVAGNVSKYGGLALRKTKSVASSMISSAKNMFSGIWNVLSSDPKSAAIGALKLSIVVAVAVASGGVAATAYKMLTSPEGWSNISNIAAGMGAASAEELSKTIADASHQMAAGHAHSGIPDTIHVNSGIPDTIHVNSGFPDTIHVNSGFPDTIHVGAGHGAAHAADAAHAAGHGHDIAHHAAHMGTHAVADAAAHVAKKDRHLSGPTNVLRGIVLGSA